MLVIVCPKCNKSSGDDWSQCDGVCPMEMSPHYAAKQEIKDETFHWFHSERASSPSIAQYSDGEWYVLNEAGPLAIEELNRRGWEYLGPCEREVFSKYLDE